MREYRYNKHKGQIACFYLSGSYKAALRPFLAMIVKPWKPSFAPQALGVLQIRDTRRNLLDAA
jgi:hypothetical protein